MLAPLAGSYRIPRQGYATRLMEEAEKQLSTLTLSSWDGRTVPAHTATVTTRHTTCFHQ
ncbi:hypothetical protein O9992_15270 [Vibrio lentus]|nr:hypothetical protein [Vibrio lentus]